MELHGISRLANIAVSIERQVKRLETSTHRQMQRFSSAQPLPLSTPMLVKGCPKLSTLTATGGLGYVQ